MKNFLTITVAVILLSIAGCSKTEQSQDSQDGKIKITMAAKDLFPSDPDTQEYVKVIEDALAKQGINIDLELIEIPPQSYGEKLTLMLISGKVPDIIYFQGGGDRVMAQQGLLENLLPYVNNSKIFQERFPPYDRKRLENFPYLIRIYPTNAKVAVIRKDWLDKLGMKPPVTVDDYYNLMKKITETDFDGNGKKDTYGITTTGSTERLDQIFNMAFGITSTWMLDKDGNYVYSLVTPYEKNELIFYRKLFKEGILDREYITNKWDSLEDKFYTGKTGIVCATNGKVLDLYETKMKRVHGDDIELIPLEPPKGISQGFMAIDVTKEERGFAISALSKHKDIDFKIFEFMLSDTGLILDNIGLEGKQYIMKDGKIELTPAANRWFDRFFVYPDWRPPAKIMGDSALKSMKIANKYYREDISFVMPREFAAKWDALTNLFKEYSYKIISGEYPPEKFDEFVQKWYGDGGEEITRYANEVLKKQPISKETK